MLSTGQRKRISRIRRRSIPAVREAYESGQISARRADTLLYLPAEEQHHQLDRILAGQQEAARRSRLATAVIKTHIDAGRHDLVALREDLQLALNSAHSCFHA